MESNINKHTERVYQYLLNKYGRTLISKKELAHEMGISNSTVDLYITKKTGIPNYKKLGTSKNSKVVFNLIDVAEFLNNTIKTY